MQSTSAACCAHPNSLGLPFQSQFAESVSGLGDWDLNAFLWGDWCRDSSTVGDRTIERLAGLGVVEKLRRSRYLSVEDFVFLRARTTRSRKITLPSPSLWANFWSAQRLRTPADQERKLRLAVETARRVRGEDA